MTEEIKDIPQPLDSGQLQLMSLTAFMHQLGYAYLRGVFYGSNPAAEIVSFNTAVKLHNCTWSAWVNVAPNLKKGHYVPSFHEHLGHKSPFTLHGYLLTKAQVSKIITDVNLQANKHGEIKVMKQWVRFTNEDTYTLFRGMLK